MNKTDEKVKRESKYQITAKGINTINFYSFNFGFIDHEEAVMYCCLLQESERFGSGWFFWHEKEKMQYGRKTYNRLRDRLCEKGLIQVINAGHNNKQHFLVNYERAIDQIGKLFKDHCEEMSIYLEAAKEKQNVKVLSQQKLNVKSGITETQIKEEIEEEIDYSIGEDSITEQQQQQQTTVQLNEKKNGSIGEKNEVQQEPVKQIEIIQVEDKNVDPLVKRFMKVYSFLREKKNLTDKYLMTEKQHEKLKLELKRAAFPDVHIAALEKRIREYRVGIAEGGRLIQDIVEESEQKKINIKTEATKQQSTPTPVQFEESECDVIYNDDDLPF